MNNLENILKWSSKWCVRMSGKLYKSRLQCLRFTTVKSKLLLQGLINMCHTVWIQRSYIWLVSQYRESRNPILRLAHRAVRVWNELLQYVVETRDELYFKSLATS
ncbi:hypothetical protein GJ496_002411 [Pomphorhynchus laevis]|nr:hypothetical protein GJ496_002411 [Pomphorhynchus laevis]